MPMSFQIGEKVAFLYESGGGTVRTIKDNFYYVEDETGFERPFRVTEIAKIHGTDYKLSKDTVDQIVIEDSAEDFRHSSHKESRTGYLKPIDVWELDLHIESLIDSHVGLTNTQILNKQMSVFKAFFQKAKAKQIRKIVIIHGVGEGVLKDEVRLFLGKQDGIEFFDASYLEYGKGATQVEIRYNL